MPCSKPRVWPNTMAKSTIIIKFDMLFIAVLIKYKTTFRMENVTSYTYKTYKTYLTEKFLYRSTCNLIPKLILISTMHIVSKLTYLDTLLQSHKSGRRISEKKNLCCIRNQHGPTMAYKPIILASQRESWQLTARRISLDY
jgi:hypothetical protein